MNRSVLTLLFAICVTVLSSACTQSKSENEPLPRVIEKFEVGEYVNVRALTVEPTKNSLW